MRGSFTHREQQRLRQAEDVVLYNLNLKVILSTSSGHGKAARLPKSMLYTKWKLVV